MAALTTEQSMIKDQATAWMTEQAPVQQFRKMRDSGVASRFEQSTWKGMVEMGWTGMIVPEQYGGSDLGYLTFGIVLEQVGRQLTASPLFASALVGASAILLAGIEAQKQAWLPKIVDGSAIFTLAIDEGTRHAPARTALQATATANGYRLNGVKSFVLEGAAATQLIVVARSSAQPGDTGGISMFIVPADATGITRHALSTVDSRGYANIEFNNVDVGADALLGQLDQGYAVLDQILDRARAGLGAEMLGTASRAFDMTLDYLKTRVQFGQLIGSFQALSHRAAGHFTQMELNRSCVEAALQAIDSAASDGSDARHVAQLCSLSKARTGAFLYQMSNDLIQIHGGIGMTDEFDAGFYLKRARALEATYGNQAFHRDRYAALLGY